MDNHYNQTNFNPSFSNDEGTKYLNQLKRVNEFLSKNSASRYMVSVYTGIPIQSVCRRVVELFDSESIAIVRKDKCKISGHWVEFLTTDPDKFPEDYQLNIFK